MRLLLTLLFTSVNLLSFGQSETTIPTTQIETKLVQPTEWQTYVSTNDLKIEYKFADCDPSKGLDNQSVLLRISNLSNTKIEISWLHKLYYDSECRTCDHINEYTYSYIMGANEVLEGECEYTTDKKLRIFSKFIDAAYSKGANLTSFQLDNLILTTY